MRYYAVIDGDRPDPLDPYSVFRTPNRGGPPTEMYDPATGDWDDEPSLLDFFSGEPGAVELPDTAVPAVLDTLATREDPNPDD